MVLFLSPKQHPPISLKQKRHQHPAHTRGDDLADGDGEAEEPPGIGDMVGVLQDERDDGGIGEDGGEWQQEADAAQRKFPQNIGAERPQQGGEGAEENVIDDAAGQQIGQQTADGESRHGGEAHKIGQDTQRLGQAALNDARGEAHGGGEIGQHHIGCRDHGGEDGISYFLITGTETVHDSKQGSAGMQTSPADPLLLSFLLSEDGCELTVILFWQRSFDSAALRSG